MRVTERGAVEGAAWDGMVPLAVHQGAQPSWNSSTTVVRTIRDRMQTQASANAGASELPIYGPAPRLQCRDDERDKGLQP